MLNNHQQNSFRRVFFRTLLYFAITIFVFDFNFYRYGVNVKLGHFMHNVVANLEREANQNLGNWRAGL